VVCALLDDPPDARHHGGEVDLGVADVDPELPGAMGDVVCDFSGPDQGFRGDAPPRDSGAADRAGLEEHHVRAAFPCLERPGDAGEAAAEHCDVERLPRRHASLGPRALIRA